MSASGDAGTTPAVPGDVATLGGDGGR
jgi:hypothetical protein